LPGGERQQVDRRGPFLDENKPEAADRDRTERGRDADPIDDESGAQDEDAHPDDAEDAAQNRCAGGPFAQHEPGDRHDQQRPCRLQRGREATGEPVGAHE